MRQPPKIQFSTCPIDPHKGEMWPKLHAKNRVVGKIFTTFRSYDLNKHRYYLSNSDKVFRVVQFSNPLGTANLLGVRPTLVRLVVPSQIKEDTFEDFDEAKFAELMRAFYGMDDIALLCLFFSWVSKVDEEAEYGSV